MLKREELKVGGKYTNSNGEIRKIIFIGKQRVMIEFPTGEENSFRFSYVLENWSPLKPELTTQQIGRILIKYDKKGINTQVLLSDSLDWGTVAVPAADLRQVTMFLNTLLPIYGV